MFRRKPKQYTWCYCPNCGKDLCSQLGESLFHLDGIPDHVADEQPRESATVRLTKRRNEMLARGIHPTTKRPLITDTTCGQCAHLLSHSRNRTYWKCGQVKLTRGPSSDVRVGWPACDLFTKDGEA